MRHLKTGRKLNRTSSHRKALFRNMVTSLIEHEALKTTDAKAKELRRFADKMITLGKRGSLHARRQAAAFIRSRSVVTKLFGEVAERFRDRHGYTRIVKIGTRHGDAASMSVIELTDRGEGAKAEAEKKRERQRRQAEKKSSRPGGVPPQ